MRTVALLVIVALVSPFFDSLAGQMTGVSGSAAAAADFSSGPSMSQPPTAPFSPDVFFDSKTLHDLSSGSVTANGWATATFKLMGGASPSILFAGSSGEGYNGAIGAGHQWIYGRGHSSISVNFTLGQSYHYSGTVDSVSGLPSGDGGGYLAAGTHTLSGSAIGGGGSFSTDITLTPASIPTIQELLGNSVHPVISPMASYISATFTPGNGLYSISDAETALGFTAFNWIQKIVSVPSTWKVYDEPSGLDITPPPGVADPAPTGHHNLIVRTDPFAFSQSSPSGESATLPGYLDPNTLATGEYRDAADGVMKRFLTTSTLGFTDQPAFTNGLIQPGDYVVFETMLAGRLPDDQCTDGPPPCYETFNNLNTNFFWKDNGTYQGQPGAASLLENLTTSDDFLSSGGVFDLQITDELPVQAAPEPATFGLVGIGLGSIAVVRLRRSRRRLKAMSRL